MKTVRGREQFPEGSTVYYISVREPLGKFGVLIKIPLEGGHRGPVLDHSQPGSSDRIIPV